MNKGINLLAQKTEETLSPLLKKLEILRWLAIGLLFLISSVSVVLFLLILLSPLPSLQNQEKDALATISTYHPDMAKLQLIDDRLTTSGTIIDKRNNFDQTLTTIQDLMPQNLSVNALVMKENELDITVVSSSLASLETFIDALVSFTDEKKSFSKVGLTSLVTDEQRQLFILTLHVVIL